MPRTYVQPRGNSKNPSIIFIGEQPEIQETKSGFCFVGPSGKKLNTLMAKAGIPQQEAYFTNVIKDLDHPLSWFITKKPKSDFPDLTTMFNDYVDKLEIEINKINCNTLVAIGNVALFALTNRWEITKYRGSVLDSTTFPGRKVIPIIHPKTILPPKFVTKNIYLITEDLKKAKKVYNGEYKETDRKIIINPTFDDTIKFLSKIKCTTKKLAYDLEIIGHGLDKQVSFISFAIETDAISIPFLKPLKNEKNKTIYENYWTEEEELIIWQMISEILSNESIIKIGQNLGFDSHFLLRRYGIITKNFYDTMVAQKFIAPEFPIGLDFICSMHTTIPYYKADGKDYLPGSTGWERFSLYNGNDSLACTEAFPIQMKIIKKQNNLKQYKTVCKIIPPYTYMMEHGIKVDLKKMAEKESELEQEINDLTEKLLNIVRDKCSRRQISSKEFNEKLPGSSTKGGQLYKYFISTLHCKAYKGKKKNKSGFSFDDTAMKRYKIQGFEEADLILKIRKAKKLKSTYANPLKIDPDGRLRTSYNVVGTKFSRASSSQSIFDTGMNNQNWPPEMLSYLVADDGYVCYTIDLSQAENRIVAFVSGCKLMMDAFNKGKDVHAQTGLMIRKVIEGKNCSEDVTEISPTGDSWRNVGKRADHGLNYNMGYKTAALRWEISERLAKPIVEGYHKTYWEIRRIYYPRIRSDLRSKGYVEDLLGRRYYCHDELNDKTFNNFYACIPQGTVGTLMNERVLMPLYYDQEFKAIELMLQLHDGQIFQLPLSIGFEEHARLILKLRSIVEQPLITSLGHEFVIPMDVLIGKNLNKYDCIEFKAKQIPNDKKQFGKMLEEAWNKL